ncbi:MAG TPA: formate--tetrahydrofolate ligase [Candidatus Sabulitectum sp.]|nr:formate--tetrahydrofolate ligase [Candidatus Sabulitectum sp.]HPF31734.1 formate--tetrahydrofolate ligase [Candidatus Sabulitectum sp.]HPJ29325.1 formate--tetrahydrofolate ligase [Candidatus Sabulitectum sp.]HPR22515.1 formate--tetrahydrofolate ligase [Candidatus Sabulitectum sp.]
MADFPSDIEIASRAKPESIEKIAAKLGLSRQDLDLYGNDKAKVHLDALEKRARGRGKLVLVSAITPTAAGAGKTTTTIGLTQGMNRIGENACCAVREPSLGPIFGVKGGAAGGGYSQIIPMEDINLHFTGDMHAITSANNLLAAALDNHLHQGNPSRMDPRTVGFRRVMDMNDRSLRDTIIGLGGRTQGVPRETGFDITAASEIMAILALSNDMDDLKTRMDRIFLGLTYDREPVTAAKIGVTGAMAMLLKDAIKPNLVQTLEGNPAFVHCGPFANIAHGCNSILATKMAIAFSDWAITEAGFGFDLGAEKFFDIKCQYGDLCPSLVVLVVTCRALKMHGGDKRKERGNPDPGAVTRGLPNLEKHLENIAKFGLPAVVCLNRFPTDTEEELEVVVSRCGELGVPVASGEGFMKGGAGMEELASLVRDNARDCTGCFKPLYQWDWDVKKKIGTIAREIYGAEHIDYRSLAKSDLHTIERLGYDKLPVCIAKTQKSLSDNPHLLGRPKDFVVTVREIEIAAGAGFLVPITGEIMRMPGLPKKPAAEKMNVDPTGRVTGLF